MLITMQINTLIIGKKTPFLQYLSVVCNQLVQGKAIFISTSVLNNHPVKNFLLTKSNYVTARNGNEHFLRIF